MIISLTHNDVFTIHGLPKREFLSIPEGQKPEGVMYDVMDVRAVVEDIDYENRTVDLRGTYGNIITVDVDESVKNFNNIKPGDVVYARYTEAVAISVRPAD